MTAFEQGYYAALHGKKQEDNPHDEDKSPWSRKRWLEGWMAFEKSRK